MPRPPEVERLPRFTLAERWVHRSTAVLVGVLIASGLTLYYGPLALFIGRRSLMAEIHVVAGLALPVPTLLGLLSPAFRADLGRLNRFQRPDWAWLRQRNRRTANLPVGKFNAGQKLAAAFVAGGLLLMFGSGLVLLGPLKVNVPVGWRQGATLVHDLFFFALLIVLLGHLWQAYRHPEARVAMRTGQVSTRYAQLEHPVWAKEELARRQPAAGSEGQPARPR